MGLKGPDKEEEMYFFVEFHIKNQKKMGTAVGKSAEPHTGQQLFYPKVQL